MATIRVTGDEVIPTVVAKEDVVVPDPTTTDPSFGRQILAGQAVPADLLEAYHAKVGAAKAVKGPVVDKAVRAPERTK